MMLKHVCLLYMLLDKLTSTSAASLPAPSASELLLAGACSSQASFGAPPPSIQCEIGHGLDDPLDVSLDGPEPSASASAMPPPGIETCGGSSSHFAAPRSDDLADHVSVRPRKRVRTNQSSSTDLPRTFFVVSATSDGRKHIYDLLGWVPITSGEVFATCKTDAETEQWAHYSRLHKTMSSVGETKLKAYRWAVNPDDSVFLPHPRPVASSNVHQCSFALPAEWSDGQLGRNATPECFSSPCYRPSPSHYPRGGVPMCSPSCICYAGGRKQPTQFDIL